MANRESRSSWKDFLLGLRERGLSRRRVRRGRRPCRPARGDPRGAARAPGSAAMCTSSGTRSITCRARRTTTACRNCAGSTTGAISPRPRRDLAAWLAKWSGALSAPDGWAEETIEETLHLLPAAAPAPQAPEEHQHARAPQRGDQAAHLRRAHLPQCRQLPAPGPGARRRDPRELDGGQPLSQHGRPEGAQESSNSAKPHDQPAHGRPFAELDAHNPSLSVTITRGA